MPPGGCTQAGLGSALEAESRGEALTACWLLAEAEPGWGFQTFTQLPALSQAIDPQAP